MWKHLMCEFCYHLATRVFFLITISLVERALVLILVIWCLPGQINNAVKTELRYQLRLSRKRRFKKKNPIKWHNVITVPLPKSIYWRKHSRFHTLNVEPVRCVNFELIVSCVNSVGFQLDPMVGNAEHLTGLCRHHCCGRLVVCLSIPQEEN